MTDEKRKITFAFRWWWYRHRKHLIVRQPYGNVHCAKCLIPAPEVYR